MTPDDVCGKPAPATPEYDNARLLVLWPQAANELRGFASQLDRSNAGLTAAQLRLAVQMAEELFTQKTAGKEKCPTCDGNGSVQSRLPHPSPPYIACPDCGGKAWVDS